MAVDIKLGDWVWLASEKQAVPKAGPAAAASKTIDIVSNKIERLACQMSGVQGNQVTFDYAFDTSVKYTRDLSKLATVDCAPIHHSTLNGIEDMSLLADMHVEAILLNIYLRFQKKLIYTYVGSILASVNPYQRFDHVFHASNLEKYRNARIFEETPHVFAIANEAFMSMQMKNRNQCVLISGESGAGKTEATKLILEFLSHVSEDKTSTVNQQIQDSSPILEALGNAKTVYNNNSSRFGKYIDIQYDLNGKSIIGARMEDYLLEKSRVTKQSKDERNFHIFYCFLKGMDPQVLKSKYSLEADPAKYHYVSQSGCYSVDTIDDKHDFDQVIKAFPSLHFLDPEQDFIFKVLSSILHIGNLNIMNSSGAAIGNQDSLRVIASQLKLDIHRLERALTKTVRYLRGEEIISNLTVPQCEDTRDAFAGVLYAKLFKWVICRINETTNSPNHMGNTIGVLDIFGFENFAINSLEQFCINYANEKLAQYFNNHIFSLEQAEYAKEGVSWTNISFKNNEECLFLIERTGISIISLLDEQCRIANATNLTFVDALHNNFERKNPHYQRPRFAKESFGIIHYAGEVSYETHSFLIKNRDTFKEDLALILSDSADPTIAELFTINTKEKPKTIATQFKGSLTSLMTVLNAANPWFVRCIKPNMDKRKEYFVPETVLNQLLYSGMLETVRIRRAGYPIRHHFQDFVLRFQILCPTLVTLEEQGKLEKSDFRAKSEVILNYISNLNAETNEKIGPVGKTWQMGFNKIFLKESVDLLLENMRAVEVKKSLDIIKSIVSGFIIQRRFKIMCKQAVFIQKHIRRYLAERLLLRMKKQRALEIASVLCIQCAYRSYKARLELLALRKKKEEEERLERERIAREEAEKKRRLAEIEKMEKSARDAMLKKLALEEAEIERKRAEELDQKKNALQQDTERARELLKLSELKQHEKDQLAQQTAAEQEQREREARALRAANEIEKNVEILELQIGLKTRGDGEADSDNERDSSLITHEDLPSKRDLILSRKARELYSNDKLFVEGYLLLEIKPNRFEQRWFRIKNGKLSNYGMKLKVEYFKTGYLGYRSASRPGGIFGKDKFKEKWFVIKGLDLFLFDSDTDALPKLMFPIANSRFQPFSDKKSPFCIEFTCQTYTGSANYGNKGGASPGTDLASNKQLIYKFHLSCPDAESRKSWIDVLMHVSDLAASSAPDGGNANSNGAAAAAGGSNRPKSSNTAGAANNGDRPFGIPVGISDSTASEGNTMDLGSIMACASLSRQDKLISAQSNCKNAKELKDLDANTPDYMFTISTRDKTWVVSAGGSYERDQWIKFLQPQHAIDEERLQGYCRVDYPSQGIHNARHYVILLGYILYAYKSEHENTPIFTIPFDHKTIVSRCADPLGTTSGSSSAAASGSSGYAGREFNRRSIAKNLLSFGLANKKRGLSSSTASTSEAASPLEAPKASESSSAAAAAATKSEHEANMADLDTSAGSIYIGSIHGQLSLTLESAEDTEKWTNWLTQEAVENSPIRLTETELFYINFSKIIAKATPQANSILASSLDFESKRAFLKQVYSRPGFKYLTYEPELRIPLTSVPYFDEMDHSDLNKLSLMMAKLNTDISKTDLEANILNLQAGLEIALKYPDLQDEAYLQVIKQLIDRPSFVTLASSASKTASSRRTIRSYLTRSSSPAHTTDVVSETASDASAGADPSLSLVDEDEEEVVILLVKNLIIMTQSFAPSRGLVPYLLAALDFCLNEAYVDHPSICESIQLVFSLFFSHYDSNGRMLQSKNSTPVMGQYGALNPLAAAKSVVHPPCHMEILSIYANNRMTVDVYTLDGSVFSTPFTSETTAGQVLASIMKKLNLTKTVNSFALYEDLQQYKCRLVDHHIKLKHVLARWEHLKKKNYDISRWKLVVRLQCFNVTKDSICSEAEERMLMYQANDSIQRGWIDMKQQGIFKLAALRLQYEHGDSNPDFDFASLPHGVADYVPFPIIEQLVGTSTAKDLYKKSISQQTSTKGRISALSSPSSTTADDAANVSHSTLSPLKRLRNRVTTGSSDGSSASSKANATGSSATNASGSGTMRLSVLRRSRALSTTDHDLESPTQHTPPMSPGATARLSTGSDLSAHSEDSSPPGSPASTGKLMGTLKRKTLGRFKTLSSRSDKDAINHEIGAMLVQQWSEMRGYSKKDALEDYLSIMMRYKAYGHYLYQVKDTDSDSKYDLMVTLTGITLTAKKVEGSSDSSNEAEQSLIQYTFDQIYGTEIPERNRFQLYTSPEEKLTLSTVDDEHIEISKILQAYLDPPGQQLNAF